MIPRPTFHTEKKTEPAAPGSPAHLHADQEHAGTLREHQAPDPFKNHPLRALRPVPPVKPVQPPFAKPKSFAVIRPRGKKT